jgi:hypothetical protein
MTPFTLRTRWTPLTREEIHLAISGFIVAMACMGVFL